MPIRRFIILDDDGKRKAIELDTDVIAPDTDPFADVLFSDDCDMLCEKNADGTVSVLEDCTDG